LKAIIFDWDLTLWNSWDGHLQLMRRTADALGLSRPDAAAIARQFHRPFFQHLAWFFDGDPREVVDTYLGFYRESVSNVGGLYPGVAETLGTLKTRGHRLAVFSDKRHSFGAPELDQAGIGPLMDYVLFLEEGRPYKPDPEGLRRVLTALHVSPDQAIYVGDGQQDVECAHRAGVSSGAALWASVDREDLLARRPVYRWERVDQILETLGRESLGQEPP
jgi:HAD superfamily hydrolase (TIGR01509 family)